MMDLIELSRAGRTYLKLWPARSKFRRIGVYQPNDILHPPMPVQDNSQRIIKKRRPQFLVQFYFPAREFCSRHIYLSKPRNRSLKSGYFWLSSAANTFSGVIGRSLILTPTASWIAFAIALATGRIPPSPPPFAPNGPVP